jgi:polyisoprenoid-binding protein YceI
VNSSGASFVGYRVKEELAQIGTTTAVGRTSAVTGQAVIEGSSLRSVKIEADLTKLASDRSQRDGQLRTQALETNAFPKATFELASPVTLPAGLAAGEALSLTLAGNLTLHGVTKAISIPVQAKLESGKIAAVGSITIQFADYGISQPRAASVLSVEDHGDMELQIILER